MNGDGREDVIEVINDDEPDNYDEGGDELIVPDDYDEGSDDID